MRKRDCKNRMWSRNVTFSESLAHEGGMAGGWAIAKESSKTGRFFKRNARSARHDSRANETLATRAFYGIE